MVKVDPAKENSLTVAKEGSEGFVEEETVPFFYFDAQGEIQYAKHDPRGAVALSEDYYGDLVWYDSPFGASVLKEKYMEQSPYDVSAGDKVKVLQKAEIVDGAAYLITAEAEYDPSQDIGWRMGYLLKKMYEERVQLENTASSAYQVVQIP